LAFFSPAQKLSSSRGRDLSVGIKVIFKLNSTSGLHASNVPGEWQKSSSMILDDHFLVARCPGALGAWLTP
jgi:hypothetical protein